MTHARILRAENGALEDRILQRALEGRRPKAKTRTILLHDDAEPPAAKPGQKRILVRIITTGGQQAQQECGRERVLPAASRKKEAPRPAGQEKADRPAEGKPARYSKAETQEPTLAELEAELAAVEREIQDLERRSP